MVIIKKKLAYPSRPWVSPNRLLPFRAIVSKFSDVLTPFSDNIRDGYLQRSVDATFLNTLVEAFRFFDLTRGAFNPHQLRVQCLELVFVIVRDYTSSPKMSNADIFKGVVDGISDPLTRDRCILTASAFIAYKLQPALDLYEPLTLALEGVAHNMQYSEFSRVQSAKTLGRLNIFLADPGELKATWQVASPEYS